MKIVVVIPTYNEALNIGRMIEELDRVFKQIPKHEMHLLVVDGNSPDGTADVVKSKSEKYSWLSLLAEPKKSSLSGAYIYAFKHAMKNMGADVVVEMDADFQHNPDDLPRLIMPLDEGFDHVIGSRFMKGGSIPSEWALHRRIVSVWGNLFSKLVLGIYSVDDFTTGFRATRVNGFLDKVNLDEIEKKGFAYKIELLYRFHKLGARIKQIPIKFGLRDRGTSKMGAANFFDSLFLVLSLRLNKKTESIKVFTKFCIVGGTGFITDAGLFNTLIIFGVDPRLSAVVSGFIAMTVTFNLNNRWSFGARKIETFSGQIKSFPFYTLSSTIPILVRSKLVALSILWFGKHFFIYNTAFVIGVAFGLIWNYMVYSRIIWKKANRSKAI